ncbi:hypothetical protein [Brevibacillus borstelensis]|jgi:hypothetical protein|uniref:hypothetical protein n=1 Tax=Brevibacillus TaxID=55080 RepID=UPI001FA986ED|nr:hypothetical protein [Brevibacillus borstelensis]
MAEKNQMENLENLENLFRQLLSISLEWEQAVLQDDADPDLWINILEKREQVIVQISGEMKAGAAVQEEWTKQYLEPVFKLNRRLLPIMEEKKQNLSDKMNQVQRSKTVNNQYLGYRAAAYGAFFDTKK